MDLQSEAETETEKWPRRKSWPVDGDRPNASGDGRSSEPQLPEQRIRAVFATNGDGSIPREGEWALGVYSEHLAKHLSFPFVARYWEEVNSLESVSHVVTVEGLVSPQKRRPEQSTGLFCVARLDTRTIEVPLAELELGGGTPNSRLVEDYWYWFWNWRPEMR
jgi:hypothetical protein